MLRSLHRKKIVSFTACAAVMFSLASCGNNNVMQGVLNELGASRESAGTVSVSAVAETEANDPDNIQTTTAEPTDEAGGNPDESSYFTIEITVMEDKYIYDNHEISYDELLELFDTLTENDVVQFRDENAALDTYQQAASALDERGIPYISAENELSSQE